MIDGHGDDIYRYNDIRMNFSSNIPSFADLSALKSHLYSRLAAIASYPQASGEALEAKIAHSISRKASEVMVTSGATEAIYLIAQALARQCAEEERTYTVFHPTFSEYDSACQMFGMRPTEQGTSCWLCNPNNPTGTIRDEAFIRQLAQRHRWLVVDQSYEDYAAAQLPDVGSLPNVICLHSMTKKYCIPGLRLGYLTAPAPVVDMVRRERRPWAVNALAIEAGLWLAKEQPRMVDMPAYLREAQRLRSLLDTIPGIHVGQTQTNFMLCTIDGHTAAELKEHLALRHGILIRDASNFPGLTPHHFRVAAQRPEENDTLVKVITDYVS